MAKKYLSKIKKDGATIYMKDAEAQAAISALDSAKQNLLTFDSAPIQNSTNPVTSGGLYTAIQNAAVTVTYAGDFQGVIGTTNYNDF